MEYTPRLKSGAYSFADKDIRCQEAGEPALSDRLVANPRPETIACLLWGSEAPRAAVVEAESLMPPRVLVLGPFPLKPLKLCMSAGRINCWLNDSLLGRVKWCGSGG